MQITKEQIHQQAEAVKSSDDTPTRESTTNEIDGTIVQRLAKAYRKKRINKKQFLLCKKLFGRVNHHQRIHLVTDDGLYDRKAFYTVKIVFLFILYE